MSNWQSQEGRLPPGEELACLRCGTAPLQPGFIEDQAQGKVRWFDGPLEFGPLGGVRRFGIETYYIAAGRCSNCHHLELFAYGEG